MIANGTFGTDAMTRISPPVTALISVTDPLLTSMTQTSSPAAAIASGPFSWYAGAEMTRISAPVAALISVTELPLPSGTHTCPAAAAIAGE